MKSRLLLVVLVVFVVCAPYASLAQTNSACAVTKAPDPAFTPPSGWDAFSLNDGRFLYGAPGLWVLVNNHWKLHLDGRKLPYFSTHYNYWKRTGPPPMVVLAKRLDAEAPLVWADHVNGAGPSFRPPESPDPSKPGFMVTSLEIPEAGCWEITARYAPPEGKAELVSYTVLVEP